jgi:hypothetical protein
VLQKKYTPERWEGVYAFQRLQCVLRLIEMGGEKEKQIISLHSVI